MAAGGAAQRDLSGWGDGVYATWVGWDAAGGVSLLMTDFAVTGDPWTADDDPTEAAVTSAAPEPSRRRGFWSRLFGGGGR